MKLNIKSLLGLSKVILIQHKRSIILKYIRSDLKFYISSSRTFRNILSAGPFSDYRKIYKFNPNVHRCAIQQIECVTRIV